MGTMLASENYDNDINNMKHAGFTLIELVMVIIILGILAATALPKFVDLKREANIAALDAAQGAVASAMNMVYAKAIIEGKNTTGPTTLVNGSIVYAQTVQIDGLDIPVHYGYPQDNAITLIAGLENPRFQRALDTTVPNINASVIIYDGRLNPNCLFRYVEATATTPARVYRNDPEDIAGC